MSDADNPLIDPYLRRRVLLDDLGIDGSTLNDWIADGTFPEPEILNPGATREIPVWRTSVYRAWKEARPQRLPKPISANSYSPEARAKGRRTRAAKRVQPAPPSNPFASQRRHPSRAASSARARKPAGRRVVRNTEGTTS